MVFAALMQSATVGYMAKRIKIARRQRDHIQRLKRAWQQAQVEELEELREEGGAEDVANHFQMVSVGLKQCKAL
ncbi:unnamed protein product, partial [Allacma fusca]